MKRSSERQITKDDAENSSDEDTDLREGFDRASAEVIANRRIVRARRTTGALPTSLGASQAPQVNPFATVLKTPQSSAAHALTPKSPSASDSADVVKQAKAFDSSPRDDKKKSDVQEGHANTAVDYANKGDLNGDGESALANEKTQLWDDDKIPGLQSQEAFDTEGRKNPTPTKSNVVDVKSQNARDGSEFFHGNDLSKSETAHEGGSSKHSSVSVEITSTSETAPASKDYQSMTKNEHAKQVEIEQRSKTLNDSSVDASPSSSSNLKSKKDFNAVSVEHNLQNLESNNLALAAQPDGSTAAKESETHGRHDRNGHSTSNEVFQSKEAAPLGSGAISKAGSAPQKLFAFGGISGGTSGTSFGDAAAGATGFSFPKPNPLPASTLGPVTSGRDPPTKFTPKEVITGEEDETELFRARCKLFVLENSKWNERGVGYLKLNRHEKTLKSRLIMRTEAALRLVLNTPIIASTAIDRATDRSVRFRGLLTEGSTQQGLYLARFCLKDDLDTFIDAVEDVLKKDTSISRSSP